MTEELAKATVVITMQHINVPKITHCTPETHTVVYVSSTSVKTYHKGKKNYYKRLFGAIEIQ